MSNKAKLSATSVQYVREYDFGWLAGRHAPSALANFGGGGL